MAGVTQLARYLDEQGISDADFARDLGVHPSTILRLKRKQRRPSLTLAERIARLTNGAVPPSAFFQNGQRRRRAA